MELPQPKVFPLGSNNRRTRIPGSKPGLYETLTPNGIEDLPDPEEVKIENEVEDEARTKEQWEESNRMDKQYEKARERAFYNSSLRYLEDRIKKSGVEKVIGDRLHPDSSARIRMIEIDAHNDKKEWGKLKASDTVALFVTVSPEPGTTDALVLHQKTLKIFGKPKKGILEAYWVIEQSGTLEKDNIGYHPHLHLLIILDKSNQSGERGKMKRCIQSTYKSFKTKSEAYLDIKAVSKEKLQSKIDYIQGKKDTPDKMDKVEADGHWRDELGLDDYYKFPAPI